MNGKSYIDVDGLIFTTTELYGFFVFNGCTNINVKNSTFRMAGYAGINPLANNTVTDALFEDVTTQRNGTYGIILNDGHLNWTIRRWTSYRDGIIDDVWEGVTGADMSWPAGFKIWANETSTTPAALNLIIEQSEVSYAGWRDDNWSPPTSNYANGIWIDETYSTNISTGPIIRHSYTHDNEGNGIEVEISNYAKVYGNLSVGNNNGIHLRQHGTKKTEDNLVYNNTTYGNSQNGIDCYTQTGNGQLFNNNIVRNNIADGNTGAEFEAVNGCTNDTTNGTGNIYNNNNFGIEYTSFLAWGGSNYSTYDAWISASSQTDNNIETACMQNPGSGDYTLSASDGCVNSGADLGASYDDALDPASSWTDNVDTIDQDDYGTGWDIGAYVFATETFYVRNGGDGTLPQTAPCSTAYDIPDLETSGNGDTDNSADGKIGPGYEVLYKDDGGKFRNDWWTSNASSGTLSNPITFKEYPSDTFIISGFEPDDMATGWTGPDGTGE
jgi:hypothetical protein